MLHLQQFVLSQSFKEMGKKRIQKMGIKSFRYIESKIGDPLFRPQYYTNQRFLFNEYIVSQNQI